MATQSTFSDEKKLRVDAVMAALEADCLGTPEKSRCPTCHRDITVTKIPNSGTTIVSCQIGGTNAKFSYEPSRSNRAPHQVWSPTEARMTATNLTTMETELVRIDPAARYWAIGGMGGGDNYAIIFEGGKWKVFYSERGNRFEEKAFKHEADACDEMISRVRGAVGDRNADGRLVVEVAAERKGV